MKNFKDLREKTLTPAEKKKREEIAKAMERDNPGMDMRKKMAIATWQAKKVAEETNLDEDGSMEESVTISPLQKIRMDKEKADRNKDDKDKSQAKRITDKQYSGYKVKMKEETEELDEISRDLARRYIRKVADKTNTGELSTKEVEKRRPGVHLAGKKVYPGIAGKAKVSATEAVEKQLFMDPDDKMWKVSYDHGPHQSNTIKVKAKSQSHAWEVAKEVAKRKYGHARITSGSVESMKEEVEQIDELSKKTLGSYIKKAKDDLGNREAEVTRNRYVDPRGVKDPVKHNNALLMKRAKRRDNINKAVDKLTREQAEDDMPASPDEKSMAMSQAKFIEYVAEEIKEYIENDKPFPEWMQNKLSSLHENAKDMHAVLAGDYEDEDEMEEAVQSADKKPEKYVRPDGKVDFRMVRQDKKVIKND
jgi:hypothetical protein